MNSSSCVTQKHEPDAPEKQILIGHVIKKYLPGLPIGTSGLAPIELRKS